jgi:hypothetical protein
MDPNNLYDSLQGVLNSYHKYKFMEFVTDKGLDHFQNRSRRRQEDQERALNILARKRQLGIPDSSKDYEELTNHGPSIVDRLMPSMQKRAFDAIPGPSFLPRRENIVQSITDLLPSRQTQQVFSFAKNLGGNRYGRAISALGRAFSL